MYKRFGILALVLVFMLTGAGMAMAGDPAPAGKNGDADKAAQTFNYEYPQVSAIVPFDFKHESPPSRIQPRDYRTRQLSVVIGSSWWVPTVSLDSYGPSTVHSWHTNHRTFNGVYNWCR